MLLLKLLVLFIPKAHVKVLSFDLLTPTYPILLTDNFDLVSYALYPPFACVLVFVVLTEGVKVKVGFLNIPKPAGLMLMAVRS